MILFRTLKYLKYILLSHHRKGHGIHSPFVFDLVTRVFRNKIDPAIVFKVEQIRKKMIADINSIVVRDLGSRSELSGKKIRKVSHIARNSPVTAKYCKLLARMASEFGSPYIIELGTSIGISAMYMAFSSGEAPVYTIEGNEEIAGIARRNFESADLSNVTVLEGSFDDVLPDLLRSKGAPGLVFLDGNHRKGPSLRYFRKICETVSEKTVIIIDDINYSVEMAKAWKEIKQDEMVSVSIDLNRMGILFFRQGRSHNDYIIRY